MNEKAVQWYGYNNKSITQTRRENIFTMHTQQTYSSWSRWKCSKLNTW